MRFNPVTPGLSGGVGGVSCSCYDVVQRKMTLQLESVMSQRVCPVLFTHFMVSPHSYKHDDRNELSKKTVKVGSQHFSPANSRRHPADPDVFELHQYNLSCRDEEVFIHDVYVKSLLHC